MTPKARMVGEVVAARLKRYRTSQGLSQEELAQRTNELGYPMARATLAKIEGGGTRAHNVSLVDVLVLAAALDVPPPLLFLPLGEEESVAITPTVEMHPQMALEWIAGEGPFVGNDGRARHIREWDQNSQPIWLFGRHRELEQMVKDGLGTDDQQLADAALRELLRHRPYMERAGLLLPPLPAAWFQRMTELEREEKNR